MVFKGVKDIVDRIRSPPPARFSSFQNLTPRSPQSATNIFFFALQFLIALIDYLGATKDQSGPESHKIAESFISQ